VPGRLRHAHPARRASPNDRLWPPPVYDHGWQLPVSTDHPSVNDARTAIEQTLYAHLEIEISRAGVREGLGATIWELPALGGPPAGAGGPPKQPRRIETVGRVGRDRYWNTTIKRQAQTALLLALARALRVVDRRSVSSSTGR
jgi:hypothetical protein